MHPKFTCTRTAAFPPVRLGTRPRASIAERGLLLSAERAVSSGGRVYGAAGVPATGLPAADRPTDAGRPTDPDGPGLCPSHSRAAISRDQRAAYCCSPGTEKSGAALLPRVLGCP